MRERIHTIKQTASSNPQLPAREINIAARQGLSDEQLMAMPSSSVVQRKVELVREIPERKDVDKKNLEEIIIAVFLKTDQL